MSIEKISIALPADMLAMVREAVDGGDYASSSEVVREALREWKARRSLQGDAVQELRRQWLEGLESGPGGPLDIDSTKRRARGRLKERSDSK
jgi:antitoxin ParD1/3/4